jgi:lantibiotic modifying enzyme
MNDLDATGDELRREAKRIYADIQDERIELEDGTTGWIGYDMYFADSPKGDLFLRGQKGLNSGQVGIALYFAAMYRVFGEESYLRDVREATDFLLEEDVEELTSGILLGGVDGFGAVVYGLSVIADLTGERRYQDRAREFVHSLTDEEIAASDENDLILGTAGTIAGLLRFYEQSGERAALNKAVQCGEQLLDNRYEEQGYRVWDAHPAPSVRKFSTGISHGSAGIGYSLYRLYGHTGREEFREAADEAIEYENEFYSEDENNWKANWSPITDYLLWWAYGVLGIGLARLGSLEYHESETLRRDVERAMAVEPQLTEHDSILRGTFAHVDLLVELGRTYDEAYREQAVELATRAVRRKERRDGYQIVGGAMGGITNPTMFLGTAGIGYTILRLLEPDEIPSVLRFE